MTSVYGTRIGVLFMGPRLVFCLGNQDRYSVYGTRIGVLLREEDRYSV